MVSEFEFSDIMLYLKTGVWLLVLAMSGGDYSSDYYAAQQNVPMKERNGKMFLRTEVLGIDFSID